MKTLYPSAATLSVLLETLIIFKGTQKDRVVLDYSSLSIFEKQNLITTLPIFVTEAFVKSAICSDEDIKKVNLFRVGKTEEELEKLEKLFGIIVDREAYLKGPYSKADLANLLTHFFFDFRKKIDFDFFELLDKTFDYRLAILVKDKPIIEDHFRKIIERLKKNDLGKPILSLDVTSHHLIKIVQEIERKQGSDLVKLTGDSLIESLQKDSKILDQYLPFYEALFLLEQEKKIALISVSTTQVLLKLNLSQALNAFIQGISFDRNKAKLKIGQKEVGFKKGSKNAKLLELLSEDFAQELTYDTINETLDNGADFELKKYKKRYKNLADAINNQIANKAQLPKFLVAENEVITVNSNYLPQS